MAESGYKYKIGRRKTATATVRLYEQKGESEVNEKKLKDFFKTDNYVNVVLQPFKVAELDAGNFMFTSKVKGGGVSAQAEAVRHALARAIVESKPEVKTLIKKAGFLTRDPRMVERKKAGLRKARKAEQYSKR